MTRGVRTFVALVFGVAVSLQYGYTSAVSVTSSAEVTSCKADVILVIDNSYSMKNTYNQVLSFAKLIVTNLHLSATETRVGVVTFELTATIDVALGAYANKADLLNKIDNLPKPRGGTSIYKAIKKMHAMFRADPRIVNKLADRFVAIVITDGKDDYLSILQAAVTDAHNDGITIVSIGIGTRTSARQIYAMASEPEYALTEPSVNALVKLVDKVVSYTCVDECVARSIHGIVWAQYKPNCHQYIVCEPDGTGKYIKHVMPCGDLFWNQAYHTCTSTKTGRCFVGPPAYNTGPPPVHGICPYSCDPHNPRYFYNIADSSQRQHCRQGLEFSEDVCTCVRVYQVEPSCSDGLLLHFDFENDFNDVTCHHAVAEKYGAGTVTRVSDPVRGGNVALFSGRGYLEVPFLRAWFANNHVSAFTVSLCFKLAGGSAISTLVNNGNSKERPGFILYTTYNFAGAYLRTDFGGARFLTASVATPPGWHHIALVYDGTQAKLYVDNQVIRTAAISGNMVNNDGPLFIGFSNDVSFFEGRMDNIRIYTRALDATELASL